MNKNLFDFFNLLNAIITTKNKNYTCLIHINNKVFGNIFIAYSMNKIKKSFFINVFYIF